MNGDWTKVSVRRDDILTCCRQDVKQGLISTKSKAYDHLKLDCDDGTNVTLMRSMRSLHWLGFCSGERVNISFMEGLRTLHETLSVFSICKKRLFIKWLTGPYNFYKTKQKHIIYGEIEKPSWKPYQNYLQKLSKDRLEKNRKLTNWPPLVRTQSRLCHFLFLPSCTL